MADGNTYREAIANAEVIIQEWIEAAKEIGSFDSSTQRTIDVHRLILGILVMSGIPYKPRKIDWF